MTNSHLVLLATARRLAETGEGARIRKAANLSLSEVATAVGISTSGLWRWERGQRSPRGDSAVGWARLCLELDGSAKAVS